MSSNQKKSPADLRAVPAGFDFVAGREVAEESGVWVNAFEQFAQLGRQQLEWFVDDQQASLRMLLQTGNPVAVCMDHMVRRGTHLNEGAGALLDLATRSSKRAQNNHTRLWNLPTAAGVSESPANVLPDESVMQRLHKDHQRLAQILSVMEDEVNKIDDLSGMQWDILFSCVDYVSEYPDAVHHPLEDRVFGQLLESGLTEHQHQQVVGNANKHKDLALVTTKLVADINAKIKNQVGSIAKLEQDTRTFIDLQRQHMAFEEKQIFPLAESRLSAQALLAIAQADAQVQDPVFDQQANRFEALYQYITGAM